MLTVASGSGHNDVMTVMRCLRNFSPEVEEVARQADQTPFLSGEFVQRGAATGTADGAFAVELPSLDRLAYAKPAKNHDNSWRIVAHEKLASDLAFAVSLPVPPVHIMEGGQGFAPWLAVSHIPFAQPRPFRDRHAAQIEDAYWARHQPVATAMRVFYTWIHDVDHGGHEENVLFGRPSPNADPELAFIDHSYSISFQGRASQELAPPVHGLFTNDDHDVMREMVRRIDQVNRSRIDHLVSRLRRLLPAGEEQKLIELIVDGKETVRQAVKKTIGGT